MSQRALAIFCLSILIVGVPCMRILLGDFVGPPTPSFEHKSCIWAVYNAPVFGGCIDNPEPPPNCIPETDGIAAGRQCGGIQSGSWTDASCKEDNLAVSWCTGLQNGMMVVMAHQCSCWKIQGECQAQVAPLPPNNNTLQHNVLQCKQ